MRLHRAVWMVCTLALSACMSGAPPVAMPPQHDPNAYPNPYHVEEGWAKLGRKFGGVSAVDMDPDGKSVWVFERCGMSDDGCAKVKTLDPVLEFDASGKLVRSWGKGDFLYPHGIFVGRDHHVWLVEGISQSNVVADVVHEYTADGKLLRTMGVSGTTGDATDRFPSLRNRGAHPQNMLREALKPCCAIQRFGPLGLSPAARRASIAATACGRSAMPSITMSASRSAAAACPRSRARSAGGTAASSAAERPTALPVRATPTVQVPAALPSPMPGAVSSTLTTHAAGQMPSRAIAYHIISGLGRPAGRSPAQTVSSGA